MLRVIKRAVHRHGGHVLCLDMPLLSAMLYGDDRGQAEQDELLMRLRDTIVGMCLMPLGPISCQPSSYLYWQLAYQPHNFYVSDTDAAELKALDESDSDSDLAAQLGLVGKYHSRY